MSWNDVIIIPSFPFFVLTVLRPTGRDISCFWFIKTQGRKIAIVCHLYFNNLHRVFRSDAQWRSLWVDKIEAAVLHVVVQCSTHNTDEIASALFFSSAGWRQRRQGRQAKENDRRIEETERRARKTGEIRRWGVYLIYLHNSYLAGVDLVSHVLFRFIDSCSSTL